MVLAQLWYRLPAAEVLRQLGSSARLVRVERDEPEIGAVESFQWRIKGDPTEGALVVAAAKAGLNKAQLEDKFPPRQRDPVYFRK